MGLFDNDKLGLNYSGKGSAPAPGSSKISGMLMHAMQTQMDKQMKAKMGEWTAFGDGALLSETGVAGAAAESVAGAAVGAGAEAAAGGLMSMIPL